LQAKLARHSDDIDHFMTNTDATYLSFAELKQQVQAAQQTGALALDLAALAPDLGPLLADVLRYAQLQLGALQAQVSDARVSVRGEWQVGSVRFGVEAQFVAAGSGFETTVVIAPLQNPLQELGGDLRRILLLLPIRPADFWVTLSTLAQPAARIAIEGHEVADAAIAEGRGYLMRFEGPLLKKIGLADTVFSLAERLTTPVFTAKLNQHIRIAGDLIELQLRGLTFASLEQLTITGAGTIRLFGVRLTCNGDLAFGLGSIGFNANVDAVVSQLDRFFFRGYKLKNSHVSVNGTVESYSVGVSGDFVINGTGHGGSYEAQWSAGNITPIPDLFQLQAARLTPSDALTVMTGVTISLPAIDQLLTLDGVYMYYALQDGLPTRSHVPSRRFAALHSDVMVLGYRGYAEMAVFENASRLKLLLTPIKLGDVLEISGMGTATPGTYTGTKVKAGGIALEVDTEQKKVAGNLKVRFLRRAEVACAADLRERGMHFELKVALPQPIPELKFEVGVEHERAQMAAGFAVDIGVDDFGVHIPRLAAVSGTVAFDVTPTSANGKVTAAIKLGPLSLPLSLAVDAKDIERLPKLIEEAVQKLVNDALANAVNWLRVALEGLLRSGTQEIEKRLYQVGKEFARLFHQTPQQAAKALKDAGYAFEQAFWVLADNPLTDLMETFGTAGAYTAEQIVDTLKKICDHVKPEYVARDVGSLLQQGGMATADVARHVLGIARDVGKAAEALVDCQTVKEIGDFLHGAGKTTGQAAEILGGAFGDLDKEVTKQAMKAAHFAEQEVEQAVERLWTAGGELVKNLQREFERAWRQYTPRIRIVIGIKL
jgi:hypothetical protein